MKKKTTSIPKSTSFESALGELETLVEQLETGEQSLEESLNQFERGMALSKFCQQSLTEAEKKIQILTGDNEADEELQDFDS